MTNSSIAHATNFESKIVYLSAAILNFYCLAHEKFNQQRGYLLGDCSGSGKTEILAWKSYQQLCKTL